MSRSSLKRALGLAGCSLLLFAAGPSLAADPIVIKFSHVVANDTPKGQGAQMLQQLVEERLGDRVKIEVYPNSSLYDDTKGLNALLTGDVQLLAPSMAKLGQYSKSMQLYDLPFLFDDMQAVSRFEQTPEATKLLESMEGHGILGLAYWHNGMRQPTANTKMQEPRDMRGLKLRVEPSNVLADQVKALRAIPRKMAFGEVYQGMQTGVIDGQAGNTWSNIQTQKWPEVQQYVTEANLGVLSYVLITNDSFWKGLPAEVRTELNDIIAEVTESVNDNADRLNNEARQAIADSGSTTITTLSADQLADWREATDSVIDKYRDEIGDDLIRAAQQSNQGSTD
ncbi:C4-dicarboxylate-binding protein DctP [Kushneria sinocarnis]|uniref:C4-dicarboxylate-binding protein DctP n=1 Tax=Kushneria sinocarnis TaxID=595502 RepID=A0A420WU59_9GAMM|nr:DctP family TRAP transporter solute-binding subunit [Kushneria sinocarnis]RKQ96972.1 C4-dicarboxylate-binding protein DctP [Kushneria sinocarnis]